MDPAAFVPGPDPSGGPPPGPEPDPEFFGVLFLAPPKGAPKDAAGLAPRVYRLGPSHRVGESVCGFLRTSRAERLGPALCPEPERILRFPVFMRPHDATRRGRSNPAAHELAGTFGLNADGCCPEGLWGPMLAVCPAQDLAWLLVDYCAAPEATRDGAYMYRRLFMYDVEAGVEVDGGEPW